MFRKWPRISKHILVSAVSITLVVSLVSISISIYLFNQYYDKAFQIIENNILDRLSGHSLQIEMVKDQIYSTGLTLVNDSDFIMFVSGRGDGPTTKYLIQNKLKTYVTLNQYIHSIYMYNSVTGDFIGNTGSTPTNLDSGFDDYISFVKGGNEPRLRPRQIIDLKNSVRNVFSLTFVNDLNPSWLVVINIDADRFALSVSTQALSNNNTMIVGGGHLIYIDDKRNYFNQELEEAALLEILSWQNSHGHVPISRADGRYLVTYLKTGIFDLTLINVSSIKDTFASLTELQNSMIRICVVFIAAGLIFAAFLSFRMFFPFQKIARMFPEDQGVETHYLYDEANRIKVGVLQYRKSLSLSLLHTQRDFLRELMRNQLSIPPGELKERFSVFSIPYPEGACQAVYMYVYNPAEDSDYERDLFPVMQRFLDDAGSSSLFVEVQGHTLKFIASAPDSPDKLAKALVGIHKHLQWMHNLEVSFVLGGEVPSVQDIHKSAYGCDEICPYVFMLDKPPVIDAQTVSIDSRLSARDISAEKDALIEAIKLGDMPGVEARLDVTFEIIVDMTYDLAKMTINQLVLGVVNCAWQILREYDEILTFNNIYKNLNNIAHIREAKLFVHLIANAVIEKAAENKNNRKAILCDNIKQYIQQNYQNPSLCTESIAEEFNLSVGYLGKLFFGSTGMSVFEFINDTRLIKAEELLSGTAMKISDIAETTGFSHSTYFSTLYKKKYGLPPKAYREKRMGGA